VPGRRRHKQRLEEVLSDPAGRAVPANAKEVLGYFLRNPQAADNLEGVARWRLLEGTSQRNVEEINQALGWLVEQGFLVEEPVTGSGAIFFLNREKATDATRLLTKGPKRRQRVGSR